MHVLSVVMKGHEESPRPRDQTIIARLRDLIIKENRENPGVLDWGAMNQCMADIKRCLRSDGKDCPPCQVKGRVRKGTERPGGSEGRG